MPSYRITHPLTAQILLYVLLLAFSSTPIWLALPLVKSWRLEHGGAIAQGKVLHTRVQESRRQRALVATVEFQPEGQPAVTEPIRLDGKYLEALKPGDAVTVRYLPGSPRTFLLADMPPDDGPWVTALAVMIPFIAISWIAVLRYREPDPRQLAEAIERAWILSRNLPRP